MAEIDTLKIVTSWQKLRDYLWAHQHQALAFSHKILANHAVGDPSALIQMPTGTGKTAVMGSIANYLANGPTLIVVPSVSLVSQIKSHFAETVWLAIGCRPKTIRPCRSFLPSTIVSLDLSDYCVAVCTAQTLADLWKSWREDKTSASGREFDRLLTTVSLIIVDEGHREPARTWSRAVRAFSAPKFIFSATPYRNDLRSFRVGPSDTHRHVYRFHQAIGDGLLRRPLFVHPRTPTKGDPKKFVRELLHYVSGDFAKHRPASIRRPKIIVRCSDLDAMLQVAKEIGAQQGKTKNYRTVIIHEEIKSAKNTWKSFLADQDALTEVPKDIASSDITFWIHQFKLTEGIDCHDFCMVAFLHPFGNDRSFVQQVGRILRNPKQVKSHRALVFSDVQDNLDQTWKNYEDFEKSDAAILSGEDLLERLKKALPEWFYNVGRYQKHLKLDFDASLIQNEVRIRPSAQLFNYPDHLQSPIDLREFLEDVLEELEEHDVIHLRTHKESENFYIAILMSVSQSPHLKGTGFLSLGLEVLALLREGRVLAVNTTLPFKSLEAAEDLEEIKPNELASLLSTPSTKVKQMSLSNGDVSSNSLRRKALSSYSLDINAPALNDHMFTVGNVTGLLPFHGQSTSRYIGFSNGRVSDYTGQLFTAGEYRKWVQGCLTQMEANGALPIMKRFAEQIEPPPTANARSILIELGDLWEKYERTNTDEAPTFDERFDFLAATVDANSDFEIRIETEVIPGKVKYANGRFELVSDALDRLLMKRSGKRESTSSASRHLTVKKAFKIVTDVGLLYSSGRFFNPKVPLWGSNRIKNLGILHADASLVGVLNTHKEKGQTEHFRNQVATSGKLADWPTGSIFHLIARTQTLQALAKFTPTHLVCEDLNKEKCDFVAIDAVNSKVAVIHAKYYKAGLSGSDFQEVFSQVVKNLEVLNPFGSGFLDPRILGNRWTSSWNADTGIFHDINRICFSSPGHSAVPADIATVFTDLLKKPETTKEVWIVLGPGFPLANFESALDNCPAGTSPEANIVNLAFLLHSCASQVSQMGASLRIFTSP